MLSTHSASSIQRRRQQHRRQKSLEVPILATPLPADPRRHPSGRRGHRRGLSLDQSLTALSASPTTGQFRPLLPQDQELLQSTGSPSVRINLDTTNTGPPPEQHFVQDTQQHRPQVAQPGYAHPPPQDFYTHLQQQLQGPAVSHIGDVKPSVASLQSPNPQQQQAFAELQHHMAWYQDTFGQSPQPNLNSSPATTPLVQARQPVNCMPAMSMQQMPIIQQLPIHTIAQTPLAHGQARTVPNTPQSYVQSWPSPPPSNAKHARSQSFQLDVAPMPLDQIMPGASFGQLSIDQGHASFSTDNGYASSAYSVSQVDPLSPRPQHPPSNLPAIFEEPSPPLGNMPLEPNLLLQATAGAPDFNDPDFDFDGPIPLSPRAQMMNNLGPDMPASIVDTGIPAYEVQRYIGELSESDNKYPCLYEGCKRRFGRKENVRAHIQTHLGDRQFKCDLCNKTFVRQHDLKRHVAIHSDDRPFVCPCGTGFARHDALTRHRQRGMCHGALPGYEKSEEEKPKRGRPKKERPDLESRVDKATKQRKKNKAKTAEAHDGIAEPDIQVLYASSSSGASEHGFPVTPPASDAFDADAFLSLASTDMQFDTVTGMWKDTPPTSPASHVSPNKNPDRFDRTFGYDSSGQQPQHISPALLSHHSSPAADSSFHGGSSPAADCDFFRSIDEQVMNTQPDVGFDPFSPPGESNSSQSVNTDHQDLDFDFGDVETAKAGMNSSGSMGAILSELGLPLAESHRNGMDILDEWVY
ncbi:cell wall transcription factor ACE2-like [Teratosphaeria destructans]|uniref:Cell wall transcription factor ACE2-like n=1 Tax=Teratosphaeria destructans TaxID=418781 RepID=A0A9W7W1U3_9PEZI|nr:cell wall transcription factor ACE2-like [Teratosphaeria destructans]